LYAYTLDFVSGDMVMSRASVCAARDHLCEPIYRICLICTFNLSIFFFNFIVNHYPYESDKQIDTLIVRYYIFFSFSELILSKNKSDNNSD